MIRTDPQGNLYNVPKKIHSRYVDAHGAITELDALRLCGGNASFLKKLQAGLVDGLRPIVEREVSRQTMEIPKTVHIEITPVKRKKTRKRGGR